MALDAELEFQSVKWESEHWLGRPRRVSACAMPETLGWRVASYHVGHVFASPQL